MELQQKNQRLAELFRESSLKEELEMEKEGEKRKAVALKSGWVAGFHRFGAFAKMLSFTQDARARSGRTEAASRRPNR